MKKLILAFAVALTATATLAPATATDALACGGSYGAPQPPPERAVGTMPTLERTGGKVELVLAYPRFTRSGAYLYLHRFTLVADPMLARLERRLAADDRPYSTTVQEVSPGLWRVVGWHNAPPAQT